MRQIKVWAYHADFGTLCRQARIDAATGLAYPDGTKSGQADWDVAVRFMTLSDLAQKLRDGIAMPKEFCGNWFFDCSPIERGEIVRLSIMAHGNHGQFSVDGKKRLPMKGSNVGTFYADLNTIGLYTPETGATILLTGCLAGSGPMGTDLLVALSKIWPGRTVVGFSTVGYRHPGEMKKRGEACEYPGMRDTDATDYILSDPNRWDRQWSDFKSLPWASETSPHAKVVRSGNVVRYPAGEIAAPRKAATAHAGSRR